MRCYTRTIVSDHVDFILSQWTGERPDIDPSPIGVVGRVSRLSRYLEARMEEDYAQFGLNGADFDVLATLRRSGTPYQLTPTALYKATMLSSGAMTNRLDRLERRGHIERRPHPEDRRGTLVTLTEQGLETINAAVPSHVSYEAELLKTLDGHERRVLAQLLRKLLISLGDVHKAH